MTSTPAPSSADTTARTWPSVNWCRMACDPSRSVESVIRTWDRSRGHLHVRAVVASRSPTRAAAAVMMSRLPAQGGR